METKVIIVGTPRGYMVTTSDGTEKVFNVKLDKKYMTPRGIFTDAGVAEAYGRAKAHIESMNVSMSETVALIPA